MRIKRLVSILLLVTFMPLLNAGCWDRRELEDQAFVIAIGFDKGSRDQLLITFRIGIPSKSGLGQAGGGGGGGGEGSIAKQSSLITTVEAPSIPAALILAQGYINRDLSLLHTKGIVFGESFARGGVKQILGILARYRELRRNIFACVCKGNAYDLLENNDPDLEKSYAKWWEGIQLISSSQSTHPGILFHEFLTNLERIDREATMIYLAVNKDSKTGSPDEIKVPASFHEGELGAIAGEIPRKGGNPVEFMGTAVFNSDKLDHVLNLTETRSAQMLTGNFRRTFYVIPVPGKTGRFISIELKQGSPPDVKVLHSGNKISIKETLSLEGDLISMDTNAPYATDPAAMKELNQIVIKNIENRLKNLIKKEQEKGIDVFGYGTYAKRKFLTEREWERYDWPKKFKEAKIDIEVKFSIRRTGMQGDQPGPLVTD